MKNKLPRVGLIACTLGLVVWAGCDPNPNGPTAPAVPADSTPAGTPGGDQAAKKGRKPGPSSVINDIR